MGTVLAFILKFIGEIIANVFSQMLTTPEVLSVHDAKGALSTDDLSPIASTGFDRRYKWLLDRGKDTDSLRRVRSVPGRVQRDRDNRDQ